MCHWLTLISPAARSIISLASPCRRFCGASCQAPVLPDACNQYPCVWCANVKKRLKRSGPKNTGQLKRIWKPLKARSFQPVFILLTASVWKNSPCPMKPPPPQSSRRWKPAIIQSTKSSPNRQSATLTPPSPPQPCNRKPRASWAFLLRAPCRWPKGSMKASRSTAKLKVSSRT